VALHVKKDSAGLRCRQANIDALANLLLRFIVMVEITRIFWKKAYSADAFLLGDIESAEVDMNNWQVTNFYVGLTDEATKSLGFKRPFLGKVVVCLPVSTIKTVQDTAILNKTMAELRNLKECKE
jgi:sporulation protein YlmC with PRC-barrel domain